MGDSSIAESSGKQVRMVAAALILRGDEVLICQRREDQPMALKWEFPGGKMEPGESAEQALKRELEEELGVDATIGARVAHTRHIYRSGGAVDLQFFVVHTFQGELKNVIFKDMRWCPLRDLPRYDSHRRSPTSSATSPPASCFRSKLTTKMGAPSLTSF